MTLLKIKTVQFITNPKPFNVSDGLVVNMSRNVVGLVEQLSLQTTLECGKRENLIVWLFFCLHICL